MQLRIYFNPAELSYVEPSANDIYIVIDAMRATTTMTVMFEQGAKQVLAAHTLEQALESGRKIPGRLLCGERHTQTPPGFDYGNSPAQFAQMDLANRELVLTTSNGTRALFACPEKSIRLAGCFYNGSAVTTRALSLARERQSNIAIVCAAEYGYFALEDSACAGYLAQELLRQYPKLTIHDSTYGAITIAENYPPDILRQKAQSSLDLLAIGHDQDLNYCLTKSQSTAVPMVTGIEAETDLLQLACLAPELVAPGTL
ncbi:2-phosphosulfolactate phosphatase [Dictyobacter arantiisoli]|uniref:Probable 2-phosphosulfolactate phosphatase n=1 Tax=Dictyobacter arantiisoli TaxID=2014874 RepID=A0A5A5TIM3_9CHLR|nr:2-phosphosulfolactate phosphatase [Dictyobacter arantiisoli]GCF10966.1 putative 2-phosphosulfolactate phosphatase [Dictyobacter arantiisoli]